MSTLHAPVNHQDHIQGKSGAKITLVEYGDYQCPHCGRAYPIIKKLQQKFGNDLQLVFGRNLEECKNQEEDKELDKQIEELVKGMMDAEKIILSVC